MVDVGWNREYTQVYRKNVNLLGSSVSIPLRSNPNIPVCSTSPTPSLTPLSDGAAGFAFLNPLLPDA